MSKIRRPNKGQVSKVIEVGALASLIIGAAAISVAAGWIVGGLAGLLYVRGLTR